MSEYQPTWITAYLAVGYAPMSYAELDAIKALGINAIVNLCGEYCDLHEIEEKSGFEVFFLPIPDENAPNMEEMEEALAWLDEAVYLGKKVLVHCRHGIGRTGTFVTAYLLRKGMGLKVASKKLRGTRANPANYTQWRLLKKYGKKTGTLTIREPSLEHRHIVELGDFFAEYESLVQDVEETIADHERATGAQLGRCGQDNDICCHRYFDMKMIEAIYLTNHMNRVLTSDARKECVNRAVQLFQEARKAAQELEAKLEGDEVSSETVMQDIFAEKRLLCPLSLDNKCLLYGYRPISCRLHGVPGATVDRQLVEDVLSHISRSVFFALSDVFPGKDELSFSCADAISGRFTQVYFHYLASL